MHQFSSEQNSELWHTHTQHMNIVSKALQFFTHGYTFALHLRRVKRNWFLWLDHAGKHITFVPVCQCLCLCMFIFILCECYYYSAYYSEIMICVRESTGGGIKKAPDNDFSLARKGISLPSFVRVSLTQCGCVCLCFPFEMLKQCIELNWKAKNVFATWNRLCGKRRTKNTYLLIDTMR